MSYVYLGLGSNLGDRERMLRQTFHRLGEFVQVELISDLYETEPVGFDDQPWFLNCACSGGTDLAPHDLLYACKDLESKIGRESGPRFGPRLIDIDLLAYDDLVFDSEELTLPHRRLQEREFVLAPLNDIAPNWRHPVLAMTVREMKDIHNSDKLVHRIGWKQPAPTV